MLHRQTTMLLEDGHIHLNQGPKVRHIRPAIDPLFMSAADEYGKNVMGVVLSGGDGDGAFGLRAITEHGGTAIVQQPAFRPSMPNAALATDSPEALPSNRRLVNPLKPSIGPIRSFTPR
jgi:two-component system chemotaxis response regulator CheB